MSKITFYRQAREDGDVRTGLSIDDEVVFDRYDGRTRTNPALRWFVDVRCDGKLPIGAEEARQWLLDHAGIIKAGLSEFAKSLNAGIDIESWPVLHKLSATPKGVRITFACSAIRPGDAREIAVVVENVSTHFEKYAKRLRIIEAVGR